MTKEEILGFKNWTAEQLDVINRTFTACQRTKKACTLSSIAPNDLEAEINKRLAAPKKSYSKSASISKDVRQSLNSLLAAAKKMGFSDDELIDIIKKGIKAKQEEVYKKQIEAIDNM